MAHRGKFSTYLITNLLHPLNSTKYAVFVTSNCHWQLQSVCQI